MAEELNRRSRLATALIAGPAVTVGLLGVGGAPVFADNQEDLDQSVEDVSEDEEAGDDEGDGAGEGAEGSEQEDSGGEAEGSEESGEDGESADDPDSDGEPVADDEDTSEEGPDEDGDEPAPSEGNESEDDESEGTEEESSEGSAEAESPEEESSATADDDGQEDAETDDSQVGPQDEDDSDWENNPIDMHHPADHVVYENDNVEPYVVIQDAPAYGQFPDEGPVGYLPAGDIVPVDLDAVPGSAYVTAGGGGGGYSVQDWEQYLEPYDEDDHGSEPENPIELSLDVDEVEAGGQVTVTASGFEAGEDVQVTLGSWSLSTIPADDNGDVSATVEIPEGVEAEDHNFVLTGLTSGLSEYTSLTVVSGDEEEADQEVTPNAPERYDNTVVIPETEGVTYEVDLEPVEAGSEIELTEDDPSLTVTAVADEGFVFDEDAETTWVFQWDPGFEDTFPVDPPEDWEADEDRWYSNVPETHLPDGYADWILDYANSANRNAEGSQEFEADTQVYLEPSMDADTIGDAFPPDGAVWWGYLEDEDFWMIVHQYTGAAGFLPGESHLGEEPPVDEEASISVDSSEVEAGDEIAVTGEGFEAGEEVDFTLSGTSLGSTTADDDGNISTELTIPEDTEPGDYTLTAVGAQSGNGGSASLTVVDPDDGGEDPEEPAAELSLDVDEVEAGGEVTATGEGFEPGEDVIFEINPELDTVSADDNGEVTAELTIPEDTEPGEHTLSATGAESERVAEAALTVLEPEGDDDDGDTPPEDVEPNLTVAPEEIDLEDFVGEIDEGAGVDHSVEGLESGAEIEYVVTGPDGVDDFIGTGVADDEGNAEFVIHGFDVADPSVYLGEYTTVVAFEDEDGELDELSATFTVVEDSDGDTTPPEDDGDDEGDDGSTSPEDDGDDESKGDKEPAGGPSEDEKKSDELAKTGLDSAGLGIIAGLMLLLGGALAAFGYRGRWSRGKA